LESFRVSGFQATNFGLAVEEINKMVNLLISDSFLEFSRPD
jgi:hypothetical protein